MSETPSPDHRPDYRMSDMHLDNAVLRNLQDIMGDEYPLLLDTFLADSAERQQLLRDACARADAQAVRLAAHSFKGSCSNMGAPLLGELCRQLEEAGRREQLGRATQLLEQLEREFAIVGILVRAERQRYGLYEGKGRD